MTGEISQFLNFSYKWYRGPPCTNLRRTVRPKEPCNVLRHPEKAQKAQLYNRVLVSGNSMRYPQEFGSIEKNDEKCISRHLHDHAYDK